MLGTMMVGNVLFVIIPGHWELVREAHGSRARPDARDQGQAALRAQQLPDASRRAGDARPALSLCLRSEHGWLVLVALMLVGAWLRLYFNLRHRGRTESGGSRRAPRSPCSRRDRDSPRRRGARSRRGGAVRAGRGDRRAALCRVPFDDADELVVLVATGGNRVRHAGADRGRAAAIEEQAVRTRAMPLGAITEMTDAERELLGRWIAQGAKVAP